MVWMDSINKFIDFNPIGIAEFYNSQLILMPEDV